MVGNEAETMCNLNVSRSLSGTRFIIHHDVVYFKTKWEGDVRTQEGKWA